MILRTWFSLDEGRITRKGRREKRKEKQTNKSKGLFQKGEGK